jgi:Asp-tRNA(Asn)/Glu-tRNA(Gln) amidotransferase A subunit family amidase
LRIIRFDGKIVRNQTIVAEDAGQAGANTRRWEAPAMANPADLTDLTDLTAVEMRRLIGRRAVSPVELLEACLKRIEALNPQLNAVVTLAAEAGRAAAKRAEEAVMAGQAQGLLHGLPVGLKDNYVTGGIRTTWGSPNFAEHVPEADEESVANLKRAGAVIFAKTNLPEFSAGGNTTNPVFGASGNPFAPELTCGGSSGGSAIGLATGMMPLAMGTDNAGSLRIPGSFCGVVGFRPTAGLVPASLRPVGYIPFSVPGPMARSVEDVWLLLRAAAARTSQDPFAAHIDPAFEDAIEPAALADLKVAVTTDQGFAPIEPGLRAVFEDRITRIAPLFGALRWADPDFTDIARAYDIIRGVLFIASFGEKNAAEPGFFGKLVTGNLEKARGFAIEDAGWAFAQQTRLYRKFQDYFADIDVMICPTMGVYPWPKEEMFPAEVDGQAVEGYFDYVALTYSITLMGHPCISLPCGVDDRGLPFGLQIVGPRNGDALLLRVAQALERAFAGDSVLDRPRPNLDALRTAPLTGAAPASTAATAVYGLSGTR